MSLYNPEYCDLLIETFAKGQGRAQFCSAVDIGQAAFFRWLRRHQAFRDAYEVAKAKKEAFVDNLVLQAVEDKDLNLQAILSIDIGGKQYDSPKLEAATTFSERFEGVDELLLTGQIDVKQAKEWAQYLSFGVNIYESTDMLKRIEALEAGTHESSKFEGTDSEDSGQNKAED